MRRITVRVPTLTAPRPAQDVELILSDDTGRRVKRRYTIRTFRPAAGELDLDALRHGHVGPGTRWAATAAPGDEIRFFGPRGRLDVRAAAWHLFAGDESAVPAIAALAEVVDAPCYALVEVGDASDEMALDAEARWVHRGGTPPGTPDRLGAALDAFGAPPGEGRAYLLGESRVVSALRPRLHALGLRNDQIYAKGYWNVGRVTAPR
jgi:NADPH-dependent ferric siderophore reductase